MTAAQHLEELLKQGITRKTEESLPRAWRVRNQRRRASDIREARKEVIRERISALVAVADMAVEQLSYHTDEISKAHVNTDNLFDLIMGQSDSVRFHESRADHMRAKIEEAQESIATLTDQLHSI